MRGRFKRRGGACLWRWRPSRGGSRDRRVTKRLGGLSPTSPETSGIGSRRWRAGAGTVPGADDGVRARAQWAGAGCSAARGDGISGSRTVRERESGRGEGHTPGEVRRRIKKWGPCLEGNLEGLQEWRVRGEIWRDMQNGGPFRGSAGVGFLPKPPNFGVEAHIEAPTGGWCCSGK
jgi:hypothetical protein